MIKTTAILFSAGLALCAQDQAKVKAEMEHSVTLSVRGETFEYVGGQMVGGNPVKGAPYSADAVTQSTQTLADGSHIVNSSTSSVYRDSEGRERREEAIARIGSFNAEGGPAKAVFISDPVAKVSYSLDAKSHTAHKMGMPGLPSMIDKGTGGMVAAGVIGNGAHVMAADAMPMVAGASGPNQVFMYQFSTAGGKVEAGGKSPAKVEQLGTQMIEGISAEGTRTTVTIPAGQIGNERDINIVSERWYSPELKVTVMSKHSDPRMGETVYKLTNVNRAEPLRSMFEVPADYTVSETGMVRTVRRPVVKDEQN